MLWLILQLDGFPRNRRFTLGERLESMLIQVLELLVQAAYSRDQRTPLALANSRLAVVRHLWRLAALKITRQESKASALAARPRLKPWTPGAISPAIFLFAPGDAR